MAARRAENRSVKDSIEAINSVQHNHTGFRIFRRYVPFACTPVKIVFRTSHSAIRHIRKSIFIRDDEREKKIKFNYIKNRGKQVQFGKSGHVVVCFL